jgi:RNA polymerase sigma-70 factor (ECF subfamily)
MENENPERVQVDSRTIQRAVNGDQPALTQIYDIYVKHIYRYHYSRVGNMTDAEDLTSQTFMAVIESLARYQHRDNFTAWIFQIARYKAMDHFRRGRGEGEIDEMLVDRDQSDVLDAVDRKEISARLQFLLNQLEEEERELIRLRYSAGLSFVEIAKMLGRKEDAVRKSIRRLLDRLSAQMEVQNA